uniref:Kinase n=1 Tax=Macrostomum lignano TaxID=282301 RepID=A0A1I8JFY3_9PLAT
DFASLLSLVGSNNSPSTAAAVAASAATGESESDDDPVDLPDETPQEQQQQQLSTEETAIADENLQPIVSSGNDDNVDAASPSGGTSTPAVRQQQQPPPPLPQARRRVSRSMSCGVNADRLIRQKQRRQQQQSRSSKTFFVLLLWGHALVYAWTRPWTLSLLPFVAAFVALRTLGDSIGGSQLAKRWASSAYSQAMQLVESRREALAPFPVRGIYKLLLRGDRKMSDILTSSLDAIVSIFVILLVLSASVFLTIFLAIQVQRESIELVTMTSRVLNNTVITASNTLLPETDNLQKLLDSMMGNAYVFGREWISKKLLCLCRSRGLRGQWPTAAVEDDGEISVVADEDPRHQLQVLPLGLQEYGHQVGGHGLLCVSGHGIVCSGGVLFKPVQQPPKGPQEAQFYSAVYSEKHLAGCRSAEASVSLREFLPAYYGLFRADDTGQFYLGLEDVLYELKRPCVMDCKMGARSTPPGASVSKHLLQRAMYAHRDKVGFIVTGFKVHLPGRDKAKFYSVLHGRLLNESGVYTKGLLPFIEGAGCRRRAARVAAEVVRQLRRLRCWFARQTSYRFYASSILVGYEGVSGEAGAATSADVGRVVVRMVDFAHAKHRCGGEINMVFETNDYNKAKIEEQVLQLWDRLYEKLAAKNFTWSPVWRRVGEANDSTDGNPPGSQRPGLSRQSSVLLFSGTAVWELWGSLLDSNKMMSFIKENLGILTSVLESLWIVIKGNLSLLLTLLTTALSILFGGGTALVFLTSLYLLLCFSNDMYLPVQFISSMSSNRPNSVFNALYSALEDATSGVFLASMKMSCFYGLYTSLTHTVFAVNLVFAPSVLAAIFGAIPFLGAYWASAPGALELWLIHGQPLLAAAFVLLHLLPSYLVDPTIYGEIKGAGHPYLTGLSVAGGLYWCGLDGAIFGPILLACLLAAVNTYRIVLSPPQATGSAETLLSRRRFTTATLSALSW